MADHSDQPKFIRFLDILQAYSFYFGFRHGSGATPVDGIALMLFGRDIGHATDKLLSVETMAVLANEKR